MIEDLHIEAAHFDYLSIQRGKLSNISKDFDKWKKVYIASLNDDFETLRPHIPATCVNILDIASGLGGINIALYRHYGATHISLLDGEATAPEVRHHCEPFNHMGVARDFLVKNLIRDEHLSTFTPEYTVIPKMFNLVLSLQGWCFHFNPETYLSLVQRCTRPGATVIVDVRRDYKTWIAVLADAFEPVAVASETKKSLRMVYRVR